MKPEFPDRFPVAAVLVAFLISGGHLAAQSGRGSVTGQIADTSGALVPGVKVELTDTSTGARRETKTTSAGLYFFTALNPGLYDLAASFEGFQKVLRRGIRVEVDSTASINLELTPGEVTQTVAVEGEAVLTNTTSSTLGQIITTKTLESVPLNGRNVYMLVQLAPGVVPVNGAVNQTGAIIRPGVEISAFNINGGAPGTLAYLLDGSPLTVNGYGEAVTSPAFTPPLEAVQEYRMENSNLQAAALSPGTGSLSLVSKSGTDKFHGSGFYFARPDGFAANDPFNKASQARRGAANEPPGFHRYQWGGSIGGPIQRGKLFFFADYEGTRTRTLETLTATVPTAAQRRGDFTEIPTIYNPFDVSGAAQRQPFSGNLIPQGMLDRVATRMQELIPLPNQAGTGRYGINNFFSAATFPNDAQKFDARLDRYFSPRHQLFGRYSIAKMITGSPDHYGNGADPLHYPSVTWGHNVVLADNLTLSPTMLLQLRGSFTRHAEDQGVPEQAKDFDITKVGFPQYIQQNQVIRTIPRMIINGMLGVGSRVPSIGFKFISYNYDGSVMLDTVRGRHQIKIGLEYQKAFVNMGQPVAPSGQYQFDTTATSSRTFAGDGFGYASYLLGMGTPTTANNFTIDPFIAHASPYYASFVQDTIRLTRNLTLNLGLRWEIFGGRTERYDRQSVLDPTVQHTVNGVRLTGGLLFPKDNQSPFRTNWRDIGPRAGIAYRAGDRGVLHAGGGMFFGPSPLSVAIAATNSDSFSAQTVWQAVNNDAFGNTVMLNPLSNPFPGGITLPTQGALGLATNIGLAVQSPLESQPTPKAYNWNAGVQYELPGGFLVSGAYVGSRGLHQTSHVNLNQLSLDQLSRNGASLNDQVPNFLAPAITNPSSPFYNRPTIPRWQTIADFPQFGSGSPSTGVTHRSKAVADSSYHSAQFKFEKRLTAQFTTLASFTAGKLISNSAGGGYPYIGQHLGFQNWKSRDLDRAVDPQDVSRWFTWALFYEVPAGRGRKINLSNRLAEAVLGGWALNSALFIGSGVPILVSGTWPNRSIFFNQRPNLTCDPAEGAQKTAARWFGPACYAAPPNPFVAGNGPRTLPNLRTDGARNLDFSIFKSFRFGETKNLQFRAETFNLTNSVHLAAPNAAWNPVDTSTFGTVTSAISTPRQLQFGLRFTF